MSALLKSRTLWTVLALAGLIALIFAGVSHYQGLRAANEQMAQDIAIKDVINENLTDQQRAMAGAVDRQAQVTIKVEEAEQRLRKEIEDAEPREDQTISARVRAAIAGVDGLSDDHKD